MARFPKLPFVLTALGQRVRKVRSPSGWSHRSTPHRAPADLVAETRQVWTADPRVRIDGAPALQVTSDGVWIAAWLLAGDIGPVRQADREAAIAKLPVLAREVYLLSSRDGLDYRQIAHRLAIPIDEVRRALRDALLGLDEHLGGAER
jgi:DNA-directed RNA polymerase specialized sigma24 family protein